MADIPHSVVDWLTPVWSVGFIFLIISTLHVGIPLDVALKPLTGFATDGFDALIYVSILMIAVGSIWKQGWGYPIMVGLIALVIILTGVIT